MFCFVVQPYQWYISAFHKILFFQINMSTEWQTDVFRSSLVRKLEEAIRESGLQNQKSAVEMENQVDRGEKGKIHVRCKAKKIQKRCIGPLSPSWYTFQKYARRVYIAQNKKFLNLSKIDRLMSKKRTFPKNEHF